MAVCLIPFRAGPSRSLEGVQLSVAGVLVPDATGTYNFRQFRDDGNGEFEYSWERTDGLYEIGKVFDKYGVTQNYIQPTAGGGQSWEKAVPGSLVGVYAPHGGAVGDATVSIVV